MRMEIMRQRGGEGRGGEEGREANGCLVSH